MKNLMWIVLVVLFSCQTETEFEFGAMTDCQYCNQPSRGVRLYKKSTKKLKECVKDYNTMDLKYVVHLGDFIDKDFSSFDDLIPITNKLKHPLYHVLGNHDFDVKDSEKHLVPAKMGLKDRYYTFEKGNWKFIALDGNDISTYAWPKNSDQHKESMKIYKEKYKGKATWNGGIGKEQISWLKKELAESEKKKQNVILYCHFPVYPKDPHNLWNAEEIIAVLEQYSCVKAYINGHNHKGHYGVKKGIHYVTLKGMVDTETTAYAKVKVTEKEIIITGYGRQNSMKLKIRD